MKYPPRRGRAAPIAAVRPSAAPTPVAPQAGTTGPPRLTPQQAAMLPTGARFVGLDGLPRVRR
jgi:hypothetical protein